MRVGFFYINSDYTGLALDSKHYIDFESLDNDIESGVSVKTRWQPLLVKKKSPKKDADIMDLSPYLSMVVTKRAKDIFEPLFGDKVEFLPLINPEDELYVLNVLNVIDALDFKKSDVSISYYEDENWEDTDEIKSASFYEPSVFKKKLIEKEYLFKIPYNHRILFTENFKNLCYEHNIEGMTIGDEFDDEGLFFTSE